VRPFLQKILRIEEFGVVLALVLIGAVLSHQSDRFLTTVNLLQVVRQASYVGLMAVAMTLVIALGDIDLSVGSIMMLVNIATALMLQAGWSPWSAALAGIAIGCLCGLVNGTLSTLLRIPTIIITLGTMSIFRGIGLVISSATPVSKFSTDNSFFTFGGGDPLRVPASIWCMLIAALFGYVLLNHTPFGWRIQAIGSNALAARYAGIPIQRYRIGVMVLMGGVAALAGVLSLAFFQSGDPNTGTGLELFVIAGVIIGGTPLSGGSGRIAGAILGALLIAVVRNALVLLSVPVYWQSVVTGAIIISAVAVSGLVKRRTAV
jgi:ribose transport system permease protein